MAGSPFSAATSFVPMPCWRRSGGHVPAGTVHGAQAAPHRTLPSYARAPATAKVSAKGVRRGPETFREVAATPRSDEASCVMARLKGLETR